MHHHTELSFVDEFWWVSPLRYLKKMDDRTLFFFGACCKRGRHLYTTTAPSCCIPASYCHLSATLQTISITVVNLQDNRVVFRIFIALLRFSFDSPSYVPFRCSYHCLIKHKKDSSLWMQVLLFTVYIRIVVVLTHIQISIVMNIHTPWKRG